MVHVVFEQVSLIVILMAAFVTHMTPTLFAYQRSHPQKSLIAAVNLVPGVGWFAGMALLTSSSLQLRRAMAAETAAPKALVLKSGQRRPAGLKPAAAHATAGAVTARARRAR